MQALRAAVRAGADAVYFGGSLYNARQYAKNFGPDELREAVDYCHQNGVRVNLTVNTLYTDRELPGVLDYVRFLCDAGVDALIVQDLGLLSLLRRMAPGLPLHASTQMTIHNREGVETAARLGASRVVLAREVPLCDLETICADAPAEIELFVHGALCYSYSGGCYMSAVIGRRSGNRGRCAGPCRLPWRFAGSAGELLSLRDLSLAQHLPELARLGVTTLKIEGRMKRPEYVSSVTRVYRDAVAQNRPVSREEMKLLADIFSRSGFTDGYFTGRTGPAMLGMRREDDEAHYRRLLAMERSHPGRGRARAPIEKPAYTMAAEPPEPPRSVPVRQRALYGQFRSVRQLPQNLNLLALAALPLEEFAAHPDAAARIARAGCIPAVTLPRIWFDSERAAVVRLLTRLRGAGVTHAFVHNLGQIETARELGFIPIGDFALNLFNSSALEAAHGLGLAGATVSAELSLPQIRDLKKPLPCGLFAYGRLPLMVSENCLGKNAARCDGRRCRLPDTLTDRRRERFPVLREFGCRNLICNSKILYLADKPEQLQKLGLAFLLLHFTTEDEARCREVLASYADGHRPPPADFTRGLTQKGVE
nr:U32 family peptidase [Feifania hominis]